MAAGRVCGVRLEGGGRIAADVVVADVDAGHLYGELLPRPAWCHAPSRRPRDSSCCSGWATPPPELAHHTVLFPPLSGFGYTAEFDAVFHGRISPTPTVYVSAPRDPAMAPPGGRAVFALVNAPRHGPFDWDVPGTADLYARHLLGVMAQRGDRPAGAAALLRDPNPG